MTNEEAIEILQSGAGVWPITDRANNAINKAIKALSQQIEDAISRQYLQKQFQEKCETDCLVCDYDSPYGCGLIDNAPPVTPKQRTGHWIVHPKGVYAHLVCDRCLTCAPYDCKTNYCPTCGIKMIEPQEREGKCKKCEYYRNPDYTRCHECKAESEVSDADSD